MKRFLFGIAFLLLSVSFAAAQGNGNGGNAGAGGNGWGNGAWLTSWLQSGGAVPQPLAMRVILEARDWGMQSFGLTLGQMRQRYAQGLLTVTYVSTSPPSLTFRVAYDGGVSIINIEDAF